MNKLIVGLFLTLSLVNANNTDSKWYIGAGVLQGSGTLTETLGAGYVWISTGTDTREQEFDTSSVPVKIGFNLDNNNRFEISFNTIDLKYTDTTESISGSNIDWLFVYEHDKLQPYWSIGVGSYVYDDTAQFSIDNEDLAGISFNAAIGLLYSIDDNVELEFAYRRIALSFQTIDNGTTTIDTDLVATSIYLGANLQF